MTEVRAVAPAKVNLHLRILGRRTDGYHDLQTVFQAVDLSDVLHVRRAGAGVQLVVERGEAGPVEENLVVRAARAFLAAAGLSGEGLRMRLEKRIPVGAGLGGGSSDAAAMLLALDRLFPGAVASGRIAELAAGIGSDVPFFLGASPLALGRGRGEVLEAIEPLPSLAGVVVSPPVQVSTREAYRELARAREGSPAFYSGGACSSHRLGPNGGLGRQRFRGRGLPDPPPGRRCPHGPARHGAAHCPRVGERLGFVRIVRPQGWCRTGCRGPFPT